MLTRASGNSAGGPNLVACDGITQHRWEKTHSGVAVSGPLVTASCTVEHHRTHYPQWDCHFSGLGYRHFGPSSCILSGEAADALELKLSCQ